jgi:cytochrome c oxidase subunit 2
MLTTRALRIALALLLVAACGALRAEDEAAGQRLYEPCAACHGRGGEGNRDLHAPRIAGLPEWYVARQLRNFRTKLRGAAEEDLYGGQMARMALQLWNDGEVAAVARYVASLPAVAPSPTVRGKAKNGKMAYTPCAACHGAQAEGNAELGAPPLTGHDDWYVVDQLNAFRTGTRGTHADDTFGQQMRAAAALLPDEQAIADVATYLGTLQSSQAPRKRN